MTLFPGVALVTGAASGIGRQVALSFAQEGCLRIALLDINALGMAQTSFLITSLPGLPASPEVQIETVNMLDETSVESAIAAVAARFGRIDYAVNSAGILGSAQRSTETTTKQFDDINGINYRGAWLCSRAELRFMVQQEPLKTHDSRRGNRGSVVNVASQLGIVGRPQAPAYCASKAAVIGMTRSDAIDYSKDEIRVNCVCPGVIATPMTQGTEEKTKLLEPAISIAPMGRMGSAQEVADVVLFLSSSKASFVQGAAFIVDGGYTIN